MATAKFIEIIRSDDNNTSYHNLYKVISVDGITGKYTFELDQRYDGISIDGRGGTLVVDKSVSQTISVVVSDGITSATATTKIVGFNGQLNTWKRDLETGGKLRRLSSNAGNELYKKSIIQKLYE